MSHINQSSINLIKCLYNICSYSDPLYLSEICCDTYQEIYGEKIEFDKLKYSFNQKLIKVIEELGFDKCNGMSTFLAIQLVPEELKEYIDVKFDKGIKIVDIDYDKAFANILHTELSYYEKFQYSREMQLDYIYGQYNRIAFIKEKMNLKYAPL
jgi:hypothetical protein